MTDADKIKQMLGLEEEIDFKALAKKHAKMLGEPLGQFIAEAWSESHAEKDKQIIELQDQIIQLNQAVSTALYYLGVDPSDWSEGEVGIKAAVECNKQIVRGGFDEFDDWGEVPEDTITAILFEQQAEIKRLKSLLSL